MANDTRRILIVDDEESVINSLKTLLSLEIPQHEVLVFTSPKLALDAISRKSIDLAISDYVMPEMDGVTATQRIRELPGEAGQVPIIALTANAMKGDREKYLAAGMTDYVSKPINPQSLFAAIARATGQEAAEVPDAESFVPAAKSDPAKTDADLNDLMGELDVLVGDI